MKAFLQVVLVGSLLLVVGILVWQSETDAKLQAELRRRIQSDDARISDLNNQVIVKATTLAQAEADIDRLLAMFPPTKGDELEGRVKRYSHALSENARYERMKSF